MEIFTREEYGIIAFALHERQEKVQEIMNRYEEEIELGVNDPNGQLPKLLNEYKEYIVRADDVLHKVQGLTNFFKTR